MRRFFVLALVLAVTLGLVACGGDEPAEPEPTAAPAATEAPAATAEPETTAAPEQKEGDAPAKTVFTIDPARSTARYLIKEQLANRELPNDAVGETMDVTGAIVLDADGKVVAGESQIVVGLDSLTSDSDRRDGYVRRRTLQTDQFPNATFVVREMQGLPWPLPTSGEVTVQMVGDLTVKDQTREVMWETVIQAGPSESTGLAKTQITFDQYGMTKPSVAIVLSVVDEIRLEIDFTVVREK
ncbi:MAG: YceI family protein [Chloroflexota bacterium]|nr:YceI family protein [Chloroflexota bacterium]MDE2932050.1 YceI family protein [Chloroflexota bacterium]